MIVFGLTALGIFLAWLIVTTPLAVWFGMFVLGQMPDQEDENR